MRKITNHVVRYGFQIGLAVRERNTVSTGKELYLHGNRIAWRENGKLWVTTAGWDTATTKERLNAIYGVHITTKRGQMFLNGKAWNGQAVAIDDWVTQ